MKPFSDYNKAIKNFLSGIRTRLVALYLCMKDPRVPWYTKAVIILVVGYAFSPIDLIPDFIPVLGYLDDLLIVPVGVYCAAILVPREIFSEKLVQAVTMRMIPKIPAGALIIILIWASIALLIIFRIAAWYR